MNCSESLHYDAQKRDLYIIKNFIKENFDKLLVENCPLYKALHIDQDKTCGGEIAMRFAKLKISKELRVNPPSPDKTPTEKLYDDKGNELS